MRKLWLWHAAAPRTQETVQWRSPGKFGDRPNFQKRRRKKQTVSWCWGKIWIMAWTSQHFTWGTQEEVETDWCDSVLQRECLSWVKLLDSMLSWKNPCETASTPRCAKALSPPVEGIFEKIDSEWCTSIGLPFSEARRGCDVGYIYEGTRQQEKIQDNVCISWPEDSQFGCFPCTDDPR